MCQRKRYVECLQVCFVVQCPKYMIALNPFLFIIYEPFYNNVEAEINQNFKNMY